jgi:hypothetical protein
MSKVLSNVYKGSAAYGRFMAILGAIFATLIAIGLIILGIKYNKTVSDYSKKVEATVNSKNCTPSTKSQSTCEYNVSYIDENGTSVNGKLNTTDSIELNSKINIVYNPNNKNEIRFEKENTTTLGYTMIIIGIIIAIGAWFWVWITKKFEFAASASGVSSVFNLFSN